MYHKQMAALLNALDNYTPTKYGENGHVEYTWSNDIREKIVQFSFQLTRTNPEQIAKLSYVLNELLTQLKYKVNNGSDIDKSICRGHLSVLYKMIGHTRDIVDGKGEYKLSYMMIHTWNKHFPLLAKLAIKTFVDLGDKSLHPYGSWKDIKYFCQYCKDIDGNDNCILIYYAISLINSQLTIDSENYAAGKTTEISLAAKWAPREKSTFGWLYEKLAVQHFQEIFVTAKTPEQKKSATLKCKTEYRKLLSTLNRVLDTLQIKQCGQSWSEIDFKKTTSISLSKQKKAFLNINKRGQVRHPDKEDRVICATNFKSHIEKAVKGETEMKGKRVSMEDFVKQVRGILTKEEKDLLNTQWVNNSTQTGALGNMIAMVDVSGSMEGDPMNVAVALGIRIAEKSAIGKRVMTFSAKPTWVNLEPYPDFVSQVEVVLKSEWGMNTNFHAALDMILDAIVKNKMAPEDVQDMVLVILSDMQMDVGDRCDKKALYDAMKVKYEAAGIRVHGKPYKPPHILFWNLRSTSGFPTLSSQPNCSMMSGFSPALLNVFCDQGMSALESCTPWSLLLKSLENTRYNILGDICLNNL